LRRREVFGGVEDIFFGGFEIGQSFVFFGRGDFLSARGECKEQRADERENDDERAANSESCGHASSLQKSKQVGDQRIREIGSLLDTEEHIPAMLYG